MARVAFDGVTKVYPGPVVAVDDLTLEVSDGEFLILVGPSGCGKSTALRMVAGLERISAGTIAIGDRVVNDMPPKDRDIAMVFQNYALYPHMTVEKNLGFGLRRRREPREEVRRRVDEVSRMLGLGGLLRRRPGQLSGGQRQRVAMGRALVREPEVFLLDEPLSNLDAKIRVQVRAEIRKLQRELGITTVYVTHDQEEALSLSDRVAVMRDGHVLQVGVPRELYERPRTRFVADFVGTNNLVVGTARAREGEVLLVETALGPIRASPAGAVGPGQGCVLAIRPENVTVGNSGTSSNRLAGRITLASYLGNTLRYDVETAGGPVLKADIRDPWHHEPLPVGSEVTLSFPPSVTLALPHEP